MFRNQMGKSLYYFSYEKLRGETSNKNMIFINVSQKNDIILKHRFQINNKINNRCQFLIVLQKNKFKFPTVSSLGWVEWAIYSIRPLVGLWSRSNNGLRISSLLLEFRIFLLNFGPAYLATGKVVYHASDFTNLIPEKKLSSL